MAGQDVHNTPEDYLLGTDAEELGRLAFQHRVWSGRALELWRAAGFGPGQTLLDLGAGPGFAARDLAELLGPQGRVLAVESSPAFLPHLARPSDAPGAAPIEARRGDATALDLPPASVDGAFVRWLLCFVSDPEAVIAGVARVLRPGGRIAIQDYMNWRALYLAPRSPAFERMCDAILESVRLSGGDFEIGARLPGLLQRHGFELERFEPIVHLVRPGSLLWQWPSTFFQSYVPRLVEMGLLPPEGGEAFARDWAAHERDPAAFLMTPPQVEVVAVRR